MLRHYIGPGVEINQRRIWLNLVARFLKFDFLFNKPETPTVRAPGVTCRNAFQLNARKNDHNRP